MENLDAFNWDAMKEAVGSDPFAEQTKKYEEDTRFYKLAKNEKGAGAAIIRFLPDADRKTIQKVFRIGTTVVKNGKKRFVNEVSPQNWGGKCPFQEEWARLYNLGEKEESKKFNRLTRYIANIKVIKDPANPENEGKIFLLDMSQSLASKIQAALEPSEEDIMTGETAKQLFNPLKGNSFKLACNIAANGFTSYDPSKPLDTVDSIYDSVEDAVNDIKENTFSLTEFISPEANLSYDELKEKLAWVTWQDVSADAEKSPAVEVKTVEVKTETPEKEVSKAPEKEVAKAPEKTSTPDLDDLLSSLI